MHKKKAPSSNEALNFSGQKNELWCAGGELGFILRMINESDQYKHQVKWFTSLVSKKESLIPIKKRLHEMSLLEYKIVEMGQGSKISRFIAWRF
jgi:23S rRNA (adenine1618-N6)-methyltransferase